MIKYRTTTQPITSPDTITSECNAITFINRGTDTAYINGVTLPENESLSINGLPGEIDMTDYKISWDAAATSKKVFVIRKVYVNN